MEEYRRMKKVVKKMIREARKRVNEEWTFSITENFKSDKKKFWKGVNEVRKGEILRLSSMRNSMGEELTRENDIEGRWIVDKGSVVREVVREEIMGALKNMKGGKAAGMDDTVLEMLKNGGISIIDWFLRIFSRCRVSGVVPEDWKEANYRGISMLNIQRINI